MFSFLFHLLTYCIFHEMSSYLWEWHWYINCNKIVFSFFVNYTQVKVMSNSVQKVLLTTSQLWIKLFQTTLLILNAWVVTTVWPVLPHTNLKQCECFHLCFPRAERMLLVIFRVTVNDVFLSSRVFFLGLWLKEICLHRFLYCLRPNIFKMYILILSMIL